MYEWELDGHAQQEFAALSPAARARLANAVRLILVGAACFHRATRSADNTGVRVQVVRRQPDGSWLRIIDRPEVPRP